MIARIWHGEVPLARADAYQAYVVGTGVSDCRSTHGNRGVYLLRRVDGDRVHFVFISLWNSFDDYARRGIVYSMAGCLLHGLAIVQGAVSVVPAITSRQV
jgi:hypothetical protein